MPNFLLLTGVFIWFVKKLLRGEPVGRLPAGSESAYTPS